MVLAKRMGREEIKVTLFIVSLILTILAYFYIKTEFRFSVSVLYYYVVTRFHLVEYATQIFAWIDSFFYILLLLPSILASCKVLRNILKKQRVQSDTVINNLTSGTLLQLAFLLLFIVLMLVLEFTLPLIILTPVKNQIDDFIHSTKQDISNNHAEFIEKIVGYVNISLNSSWNKPQAVLEINNMLSRTDYAVLRWLDFDIAHVVFFQKWGSCGEYAIATTYLLNSLGFKVRIAHFTNIDHSWAEVRLNNSWYIVDPWYIGLRYDNHLLIPVEKLASLFVGNHTVIVTYLNGTQINASKEHGYKPTNITPNTLTSDLLFVVSGPYLKI